MKYNFQFSNLCGCVYRQGNIIFTGDGNSVISPVGNRVTVFDLVNHKSQTLPFQQRHDIRNIALSPNNRLLISIDSGGFAVITNFLKRVTLATMKFKSSRITAISFSPDSKYLAVAHDNWVSVWKSPDLVVEWKPMLLHGKYKQIHYNDILCINWSPDSQFFVTGSKDMSARVHALHKRKPFVSQSLTAHKGYVIGAFFGSDFKLYTLTHEGWIYKWIPGAKEALHKKYSIDSENENSKRLPLLMYAKFTRYGKHRLHIKGSATGRVITSASFHSGALYQNSMAESSGKHNSVLKLDSSQRQSFGIDNDLLVIGKANGVFDLYSMPTFDLVHSLTVSKQQISSCVISPTGDWLAFASARTGQLSVWEWRSETYILRQQSHFFNVNTLAFSPDGQLIATGGDDGKLKLWNANTGFCFITFHDHQAPITKICFANNGVVVVTASLDGTVRVYDLVRYVNFRTLKPPTREALELMDKDDSDGSKPVASPAISARFISLAIDPTGEVICAGSEDPFHIYVWSMRTGKVLDVLTGHEGPISALSFSTQNQLASGSWDKTVRIWDVYNHRTATEIIQTQSNSEVLDITFSPDGKELCSSTLDGHLEFYEPLESGSITRVMDIRKDAMGGRKSSDLFRAEKNARNNHYTCISYSPDGTCILAGGNSTKYIGMYFIPERLLLTRYMTSTNKDLEGVLETLNMSRVTKTGFSNDGTVSGAGSTSYDTSIYNRDEKERNQDEIKMRRKNLPGVDITDQSTRKEKAMVGTRGIAFSPNGLMWAAVTSDGILIYSQQSDIGKTSYFDPIQLDVTITPASIKGQLQKLIAFRNGAIKNSTALQNTSYLKVLIMALKLNESQLIATVLESIPTDHISVIIRDIPFIYFERLFQLISFALNDGTTQFLEFYLLWIRTLLTIHGSYIKTHYTTFLPSLRLIQKQMTQLYSDLSPICEGNVQRLKFLSTLSGETAMFGRQKLNFEVKEEKSIALTNPHGDFQPIPFQKLEDDPFAKARV